MKKGILGMKKGMQGMKNEMKNLNSVIKEEFKSNQINNHDIYYKFSIIVISL